MSSTSILDRYPENKDRLAAMFGNGLPHRVIAEEFGVHIDTVGVWKKRPDIQTLVTKFIRERANAILAHTDTAILKRLEQARDQGKPIPLEVLLRVRQTMAADAPAEDPTENEKPAALGELMTAISEDPELASRLGLEASTTADD